MWLSIQDQQPAMGLISSWQIGPTKGLQLAIACYNLNPVYLWPFTESLPKVRQLEC
jgi:hypothetical protein